MTEDYQIMQNYLDTSKILLTIRQNSWGNVIAHAGLVPDNIKCDCLLLTYFKLNPLDCEIQKTVDSIQQNIPYITIKTKLNFYILMNFDTPCNFDMKCIVNITYNTSEPIIFSIKKDCYELLNVYLEERCNTWNNLKEDGHHIFINYYNK